jgi:hypothetical protein
MTDVQFNNSQFVFYCRFQLVFRNLTMNFVLVTLSYMLQHLVSRIYFEIMQITKFAIYWATSVDKIFISKIRFEFEHLSKKSEYLLPVGNT